MPGEPECGGGAWVALTTMLGVDFRVGDAVLPVDGCGAWCSVGVATLLNAGWYGAGGLVCWLVLRGWGEGTGAGGVSRNRRRSGMQGRPRRLPCTRLCRVRTIAQRGRERIGTWPVPLAVLPTPSLLSGEPFRSLDDTRRAPAPLSRGQALRGTFVQRSQPSSSVMIFVLFEPSGVRHISRCSRPPVA